MSLFDPDDDSGLAGFLSGSDSDDSEGESIFQLDRRLQRERQQAEDFVRCRRCGEDQFIRGHYHTSKCQNCGASALERV